jgi:hypothetical protein
MFNKKDHCSRESAEITMNRRLLPPLQAVRGAAGLLRSESAAFVERQGDRTLGRGHYARPLDVDRDRVVLLFYENFEQDRLVRGDRLVVRALRRLYHASTAGRTGTGIETAFRLLVTSLERAGYRVVVNDHALARRNPRHPVGIAGYSHVLDLVSLPNPAVLGPGLFDHPAIAPRLMEDPRFASYLVPSAWTLAMFEATYGGRCAIWFAGIDLSAWPDRRAHPKDIDVLVYDKVTCQSPTYDTTLVQPLLRTLKARGRSFHILNYAGYTHDEFRALLARSRAMAFLSEHETQGIAYQEAMASNVPILAWDQGSWLHPRRRQWQRDPVPASSVPYFSEACGVKFREVGEIPRAVDALLAGLDRFEPRRFVAANLSLRASADRYLAIYHAAARASEH